MQPAPLACVCRILDRLQRRFAAMADGRSTLTASRHANQHACTSISTCMAAPLNTPIKRCRLD